MSSSISFGGKCATVLIGAGLSWFTVTHPDIDQAIGKLFGSDAPTLSTTDVPSLTLEGTADLDAPLVDVTSVLNGIDSNEVAIALEHAPASEPVAKVQDVQEMATRLRSLGASYLLLERLPQQAGDQFRARCDLEASGDSVRCCFEAVRSTPEQAMAEVLQAVVAAQGSTARPEGPPVRPSSTSS